MVESKSSKKTTQLGNREDQNPRKFYSRFLFKALILAVLCAVVPVFLSQTPELANQTRLLELVYLVLVGIAVSYGLFSRRNHDRRGSSNDHKSDHNNNNSQSYVPKILDVSSVFNVDHESESDDFSGNQRKFQTWRNKYHMKIHDVVHSKDHETRFVDRVSSENREKPLLLPVRSLNYSRGLDLGNGNSGQWEKVRSKRELLKTLGDDNSDVLPSPIPWRSRSLSKEIESQPLIKNLTTNESQPLIKNLTPSRKSTPLPTLASEFHPPPPPPPPPPPLPAFYYSASKKAPGIYRVERRESSVNKKKFAGGEFHPPPPPPPPPPSPPPADYYKSPQTKLRVSSERRKSSEQKMKFDERSAKKNSTKKVWWSAQIVESKEERIIREETKKNEQRSFSRSKESEDEEHRRRENEIHEDDEKKIDEVHEEEVVSGSDVDKKADAFIAKFREQIRLQRIDSIKRSAYKISANPPSR